MARGKMRPSPSETFRERVPPVQSVGRILGKVRSSLFVYKQPATRGNRPPLPNRSQYAASFPQPFFPLPGSSRRNRRGARSLDRIGGSQCQSARNRPACREPGPSRVGFQEKPPTRVVRFRKDDGLKGSVD